MLIVLFYVLVISIVISGVSFMGCFVVDLIYPHSDIPAILMIVGMVSCGFSVISIALLVLFSLKELIVLIAAV